MSRLSLGNVLEAWQGVALEDLRPEIHRYAQAMKYAEIRSQKARKSLTIMLQCLKQTQVSESDTSVINKAVSGTIKSFQKEVDELTQRSSFAEACFLQIYSKFYEAPDPVPVLSKALIEMQKLQDFKSEQGKKQNLILESDHRLTRSVEGEVSGDNILAQAKKFELEKSRLLEESQLRENLLQQELQKCRDLLSKTQAQLDDIQSRFVMFHNRKENEEASRVQFSNSINEELLILKSQLAAMKHENMTLKESLSSDLNDNTVTAEVKRRIADLQQQLGQLLKNYNLCLQENETLRQQLIKYANNKIMFEQSHQAEVKLLQSKIESLNDAFRLVQSSDKSNALQQQNKMRQEAEGNAQEGEFANCIEARVNKSEESRPNSSWMQLEEPSAKDDNTLTGDPPRTTASALSGFGSSNRSGAKDFFSFQRDRYRKALESMEIEKSTLQCRNESLIQQLKVLKSDNENLFLRLKAAHSSNKNRGNDLEHGNLLENKYAKIVAERENPFSKFALSRGLAGNFFVKPFSDSRSVKVN